MNADHQSYLSFFCGQQNFMSRATFGSRDVDCTFLNLRVKCDNISLNLVWMSASNVRVVVLCRIQ